MEDPPRPAMTVEKSISRNASHARAHSRRRLMLRRGLRRLDFLVQNDRPTLECLGPLRRWWGNGGATADPPYLDALSRLALRANGPILECGSGLTTLVLGQLAGRRGIDIWSLEHHPDWFQTVGEHLSSLDLHNVHLCHAPLRSYGQYMWYVPPIDRMPEAFSLVACDGPPGRTRGGRYGLLPVMGGRLAPDVIILLDDAQRPGEREAIRRWQDEFAAHGTQPPDARSVAKITLDARTE